VSGAAEEFDDRDKISENIKDYGCRESVVV
jgi:hypothetical protein